jgi:CRP/FNR family transcriptional regulator, cyclic AMP receptor protein
MENLSEVVWQIPMFSRLSPETLEALIQYAVIRKYAPGEMIQEEGEPCVWAGFIVSGSVQVYRLTASGREQVFSNLGPGMQFNAVPALDPQGRLRASIEALTETRLLLIPAERYRALLQTQVDLTYAVLTALSDRVCQLTTLVERLSLHSIRGRLAGFLIEQADKGQETGQWTQDEIAAHLGTVRDVVGRTLRAFLDAGLIRRDGGKLILVDRQRLEEEARF